MLCEGVFLKFAWKITFFDKKKTILENQNILGKPLYIDPEFHFSFLTVGPQKWHSFIYDSSDYLKIALLLKIEFRFVYL